MMPNSKLPIYERVATKQIEITNTDQGISFIRSQLGGYDGRWDVLMHFNKMVVRRFYGSVVMEKENK